VTDTITKTRDPIYITWRDSIPDKVYFMKLVSWNTNGRDVWRSLSDDVDVALLQEARDPMGSVEYQVCPAGEAWRTLGWESPLWHRAAAVAAPSGRFKLRPYKTHPAHEPVEGGVAVSRPGTLAIADVMDGDAVVVTVASAYASWQKGLRDGSIFADASVHSLLSDLSPLITHPTRHRLIVAGDLNVLFGYGEDGSAYWAQRYENVFARANAMGLVYVGPAAPHGRRAHPWPEELPRTSLTVPTYYPRGGSAATASRQLDHVFASRAIADSVSVRALNGIEEWGPSDHCRVEIDLDL
jgi:hypothetical protein